MAGRKSDFTLTKLDDLFSTQEQRDEEKLSKIRDIPLTEIDDFPDHPFKVRDDEDMAQLIESIKERGVITPATVRQKEDGRYELISGHRRKRACELAGFDTLRCEVVELNRDEATILMVESNYQRSQILPSEKAFAYKMRLEAMNRQAGRPKKENSTPVVSDFERQRTNEVLANEVGESRPVDLHRIRDDPDDHIQLHLPGVLPPGDEILQPAQPAVQHGQERRGQQGSVILHLQIVHIKVDGLFHELVFAPAVVRGVPLLQPAAGLRLHPQREPLFRFVTHENSPFIQTDIGKKPATRGFGES